MRALLSLIVILALPLQARAADVVVDLKSAGGQPVANAVVSFKPASGVAGAGRFEAPYRMSQDHIQFNPFVLMVPLGAEVAFPNKDKVRHHVYSFSPAKIFQLKLYGQDETRSIVFDKPGVIALGCNIHDQMIGFIVVLDTPYAAKSGPSGQVTIPNVPPGGGVLTIWHPYLRAVNNIMTQSLMVPGQGVLKQAFVLALRDPPEGKKPLS